MSTYQIFHFRAGALKGQTFEAESEAAALQAWADSHSYGPAVKTREEDGRPYIRFVMRGTDIVLHEYTAREVPSQSWLGGQTVNFGPAPVQA